MSSIAFKALNVDAAAQFKESVSEPDPNTKIYLCYGKITSWPNDSVPSTANADVQTEFTVWNNMVGAKKVTGNDLQHVIKRNDWTANTVYTAYSHKDVTLFNSNVKFFVMTSDNHVYKCLSNNNSSNSTVEPTAVSTNTVTQTSDGYIWKYMYTVDDADMLRFGTSEYIPVKTIESDDGSTQWDVQEGAVDGGIYAIIITSGGSGYSNASNITVTIRGDGTEAAATANINATSQTINSITITNPGSGYHANAYITIQDSSGTPGISAAAYPVLSPPGGHGSDALNELGGSTIMINMRLIGSESNVFPVGIDYRQISLIKNPLSNGSNIVASNSTYSQSLSVTTTGSGSYEAGEIIYQGASQATSTFRGYVLQYANSVVDIVNPIGELDTGEALTGANTTTSRVAISYVPGGLEPYTGRMMYVNNFTPITRANDQTEDFKLTISF